MSKRYMKIITRKEAKALGLSRYFTGKPCVRGHIAERKTCDSTCWACDKENLAAYWKNNPDKAKARNARNAAYNKANKEQRRETTEKYRKANLGAVNALLKKRRAAQLQRMPAWLTEDDLWLMKEVYELAALRTKLTGVKWEVDHIVPLCGVEVSGLHVPSNLQVITKKENVAKRNAWSPDNA